MQRNLSALVVGAVVLSACVNGPSSPPVGPPGSLARINLVAGAGASDTVDATLTQALTVEVRDSLGNPARDVTVRFEAQFPRDSVRGETAVQVCDVGRACRTGSPLVTGVTDIDGRASALIRMGVVAGPATVKIVVPTLGLVDSAMFTVQPGKATRIRSIGPNPVVNIGATRSALPRVVDRYGNTRNDVATLTLSAGAAITLDAANGTLTGRDLGAQYLVARVGTTLVDSVHVRSLPSGRLAAWLPADRGVSLVNLDGTDSRPLTTGVGVASDLGVFPRFTTNKQRVAFFSAGPAISGPPTTITVVDTTAGVARREILLGTTLTNIHTVRPMPDGSILLVAYRLSTGTYWLWRLGTDDSITPLVVIPGFAVVNYGGIDISSDGSRVAFVVSSQLRILNAATGDVTVTAINDARAPRWSPQGDRIAFLVSAPFTSNSPLAVINADGSGRRTISPTFIQPGFAWSPDGTYIVGRESGSSDLELVRVTDGAKQPVIFSFPGQVGTPGYLQLDWR